MSTRPFLLASPLALAVTLALSGMAQAQVMRAVGRRRSRARRPPCRRPRRRPVNAPPRRLSTPQPPTAPEKAKLPVTGGANFDLMSHYVWRGFVLTDASASSPPYGARSAI